MRKLNVEHALFESIASTTVPRLRSASRSAGSMASVFAPVPRIRMSILGCTIWARASVSMVTSLRLRTPSQCRHVLGRRNTAPLMRTSFTMNPDEVNPSMCMSPVAVMVCSSSWTRTA
eukprot:Amastigsp_a349286_5.p3 type:complete len:118 gc:universal Amastigsp_a349286_5:629-276(-)